MAKKMVVSLLALLLACCTGLPVVAVAFGPEKIEAQYDTVTDPDTGLTYSVSYSSQVRINGVHPPYSKSLPVSLEHEAVKKLCAEYDQKVAEAEAHSNEIGDYTDVTTYPWHLAGGYVRQLSENEGVFARAYFGLSETFSGSTVIEKEGIPFKVTGNGKGQLSVQCIFEAEKITTTYIDIVFPHKYELKEERKDVYNIIHYINEPGMEYASCSKEFSTLEDALNHCVEHNVDRERRIDVIAQLTYARTYINTAPPPARIELEYGNYAAAAATTKKATSQGVQTGTATETTATTTAVTAAATQGSTAPSAFVTESTASSVEGETTTVTTMAPESATTPESEPSRSGQAWWYTLIGAAGVGALVAVGAYFLKKAKNS